MTKPDTLVARLDNLPISKWHIRLMVIVCLGILFDAYDTTIMSVAFPQLMSEWGITKVQTGLLGSAGFIGMLIGALFSGILSDYVGRVRVFQYTIVVYALFMGVCAFTNSFPVLFALRILVGIGLGGLVPVGAAYLSEYIPSKVRGRFMSIFNANFSLGVTVAYAIGFLIVAPYGWRWGFIIGALPVFMYFAAKAYLPESARFLLQKNKVEDAVKTVETIEKQVINTVSVPFEEAVRIEKEVKAATKEETKASIAVLFKKDLIKTTIMVSILWFSLQYSIYAIMVWMPILLKAELGYSLASGLGFLAFGSLLGALATPLAGVSADFIGRKITVLLCFILYGLSAYFLFWFGANPAYGTILLVVNLIILGMANGIVYVYSPENFPTKARGTGMGLASATGRLGGILGPTIVGIIYSFSSIETVLHINMAVLLFGSLVVMVLGRETRNKTLEEISGESVSLG
ncbi:MAG: MFS transporter [Firmicutes bacterium]|nr:MFS transporter [Bacillota bacterium]